MTEVLHKAVRATTSEVMTLSYIDDTVLVGPADDIAQILQDLPRALDVEQASAYSRRKHNCGHRMGTNTPT